jgi:hypothetical protein
VAGIGSYEKISLGKKAANKVLAQSQTAEQSESEFAFLTSEFFI